MIAHDACRSAVLEDQIDDEVRAHLESCEACRAFSEKVARVVRAAPQVGRHRPPAGLAERVIEAVRQERRETASPEPARPRARTALQRRLLAAASIAAVIALLAAVLSIPRGGDDADVTGPDDLSDALLAAADATEAADTARVAIEGRASLSVGSMAQGGRSTPSVRLPGRGRQTGIRRGRRIGVLPGSSSEVTFEGSGAVVRPDRLALDGAVTRSLVMTNHTSDVERDFGLRVIGGKTYILDVAGKWRSIPRRGGPLGVLLLDPDGAAQVLRNHEGSIEDLGEETSNGETVRHYRFDVEWNLVPPFGGGQRNFTAQAWIGEDDLLRRLVVDTDGSVQRPYGPEVSWSTSTTLTLTDFGADLSVDAPPPRSIGPRSLVIPAGPTAVLFPFHENLFVPRR